MHTSCARTGPLLRKVPTCFPQAAAEQLQNLRSTPTRINDTPMLRVNSEFHIISQTLNQNLHIHLQLLYTHTGT